MSVALTFVSGHYFGLRALTGILESAEYSRGQLELSLLLSLDFAKEPTTVGFHDFSDIAAQHKIPHKIITSVKHDTTCQLIRKANPDFLLVIGLSELVPSPILDIPRMAKGSDQRHSTAHGCIGMHPTLLPRGRGRASIPWAIIKGLDHTGVTVFLLEEEADSGGIVLQESIHISPSETATSLFAKCATTHQLLGRSLAAILASRSLTWAEQDASQVTAWPKRKPQDGLIRFDESVHAIDRLVRALAAPYPGAFFYYEGRRIAVNEVEVLLDTSEAPSGSIVAVSPSGMPTIAGPDGAIRCITLGNECGDVRFTVGVRLND